MSCRLVPSRSKPKIQISWNQDIICRQRTWSCSLKLWISGNLLPEIRQIIGDTCYRLLPTRSKPKSRTPGNRELVCRRLDVVPWNVRPVGSSCKDIFSTQHENRLPEDQDLWNKTKLFVHNLLSGSHKIQTQDHTFNFKIIKWNPQRWMLSSGSYYLALTTCFVPTNLDVVHLIF